VPSSAKPEVHDVSQCRQRRTEPRPQAACTKIGKDWPCAWFSSYGSGQTDRHTHHNIAEWCMQKHEQYGSSVSLAMSADATCRGLRSASDGPFLVQFNKGIFSSFSFRVDLRRKHTGNFSKQQVEATGNLMPLCSAALIHDLLFSLSLQ